ncbi:HemK2/MTQ2 family protein methyltransferase [Streptomyces griseoincarnatus]
MALEQRGTRPPVKSLVLPGVYAPQEDTALLAAALADEPVEPGAAVLDVGTGSGALALTAARRGARVTAVDVSRRAVYAARLNALRAGLPLEVVRGNLFEPVRGRSFDLVLANPPYVPAPRAHRPPRGPARAWDAGGDGRLVLDRICHEAPGLLRPGGVLLLVQSALSDPGATVDCLRSAGLKSAVTQRQRIAFGPVLRTRVVWLRERGLLSPDENDEELVVVRAEQPV